MPVEQVFEFVHSSAPLSVDREAGLIRGVKILGLVSANKRRYSAEAVREAVGLYEGVKVNVNHPQKAGDPRDARDRFGRLVNVEARADGLYGNLEYLKSHPLAASISEAAERMPSLYGLSHVAECNTVRRGKENVIEGIKSVLSVDLVSDPATTHGLYEGKNSPMPKLCKEVLEDLYPEHKEKTIKLMEEEGMLPAEPMAMPAEASAEDQADAAFKSMVVAVLDDTSLDVQGKLGKIREILKAQEKLTAKAEEPAADSGASEEGGSEEQKQPDATLAALQEQVRRLTAEKEVRKELKDASLSDAEDTLVESLCGLSAEARKPIVASLKKPATEQKPRSGFHTEHKTGNGKAPKDVKEFVSSITTRRW